MQKKIILIIAIVLSVIALILGTISAFVFGDRFSPNTNVIQELPTYPIDDTKEETLYAKNILLVGTDKSGELSDVIIVARYNPQKKIISLLSIPRDTKVTYGGENYKINSLYKIGLETLTSKVETITDLHIDNYVVFSTNSFKEVIDILGGVEFNVPQNMNYSDPHQNLKINLKKGLQVLDGEKAEQLVRFRKYRMGDIDRIKVQQDFIKALIEQKLNASIIPKAPALLKEILYTVKTDLNFKDVMPYLDNIPNIKDVYIKTETLPGTPSEGEDASYWLQDEEATKSLIKRFSLDLIEEEPDQEFSDITSIESIE